MSKIYAVCKTLNAGSVADKKYVEECKIQIGDKFELVNAKVFRWDSIVWLDGFDKPFNSVFFDYFDEEGDLYNIYQNEEFQAWC